MNIADIFKQQGYVIIRNMFVQEEIKKWYDYTLEIFSLGNPDDGQVPGSMSFYQDKEMAKIQKKILPQVEQWLDKKLFAVFCYHRVYRKGAILRAHKDGRSEISISLNLGQQGTPWDFWLMDYDENARRITLHPGDAIIYHGCKLHHWRAKLTDGDYVSQVFFQFVHRKGKYAFAAKAELLVRLKQYVRKIFGSTY